MPGSSTRGATGQPEAAGAGDALVVDEGHCCNVCRFCDGGAFFGRCTNPESPLFLCAGGGVVWVHVDCCRLFERRVEG